LQEAKALNRLLVVARCKAYEIKGDDPNQKKRRWSAVRCVRDSAGKAALAGKSYPVCKKHRGKSWRLFAEEGWLYAMRVEAKK
jgi:hypothetical protein